MSTGNYFTIVLKQGYGIGGFESLDKARRYCRGEDVDGRANTMTDFMEPRRIDEYAVPTPTATTVACST